MARNICLKLASAQPVPVIPVPGVGSISTVRQFTLNSYDVCDDARSFLLGIQPVFSALGLPLCLLGCLTAVTGVFKSSFPYINPAALPKIVTNCACIGTFTPFGFCGLLKSVVNGMLALADCITGLISDIVRLEKQAAALMSDPKTASAGQCLLDNSAILRDSVATSFGAVKLLFDATEFLFTFVGIPFTGVEPLDGGSSAAMLASMNAVKTVLMTVSEALMVCP